MYNRSPSIEERLINNEDWSRNSALEAFKQLITECTLASELRKGHRALAGLSPSHYKNIATSLDLITTLFIPSGYRAGHVLAGMKAQENPVCQILSRILTENGVKPIRTDGPMNLWHYIAGKAKAAAYLTREKGDRDLSNRYYSLAMTYQRGGDNL